MAQSQDANAVLLVALIKFKMHSSRHSSETVSKKRAYSDFKSQGQTIETVVVDLGKPPTGALLGFNAYVALSQSRGRKTIHLKDFDEKLFTIHPNEELRKEDNRLDELEKETLARYRAGEWTRGRA